MVSEGVLVEAAGVAAGSSGVSSVTSSSSVLKGFGSAVVDGMGIWGDLAEVLGVWKAVSDCFSFKLASSTWRAQFWSLSSLYAVDRCV